MENEPQHAAVDVSPTRRAFYIGFINGAMSLIGLALAVPAAVYLLFPPKLRKEAEWVDTADLSTIPAGTPTEIAFERKRVDGWKTTTEKATAWVVKKPNNDVVAFTPQCTHLGCAYHWDDPSHTFMCPCHNSVFSVDGQVLSGPAPRPLDRYMTKIDAGKLEIGPVEPHA
ncbi:MAG TPA: ubiquinol-cytochrome c reductase iron-sulfur subunit [Bryobacteraceae bacterium]|jgi:menaquinol-cytochrome c reductase iron-sulfur subunit|nr:ubiquinol-cytochrome c reductase iron-sulfur subunit [Bryobacteraceae bacterium]